MEPGEALAPAFVAGAAGPVLHATSRNAQTPPMMAIDDP